LKVILIIPCIVVVESSLGDRVFVRLDLHLEIIAEMTLASNMCEKMADVGEIGFSRAYMAAESGIAASRGCCVHDGVDSSKDRWVLLSLADRPGVGLGSNVQRFLIRCL
jgi:hypothetical protein